MGNTLLIATLQTLYMVGISTILSLLLGVPLGLLVTVTNKGHLCEHRGIYLFLDSVINVTRSFPFIILMILILPISRYIVGTTIGSTAAIIPLAIAAAPFVARIIQGALLEVDLSLIQAAKSLGASRRTIIGSVLFPEAKTAIVNGIILLIINLIGYSAMAGAIGGGGLGDVAITYGYERYDIAVMMQSVVLIILIVQIVQYLGNLYVKNLTQRKSQRSFWIHVLSWIAVVALITGGSFYLSPKANTSESVLVIGATAAPHAEILEHVKPILAQEGIDLKIVVFNDFVTPNLALEDGSIQANYFQNIPYMDAFNASHHMDMVSVGAIHVEPFGIYSDRYHTISEIPTKGVIIIPSDPSNQARALKLLQKAGLIKIKMLSSTPSIADITSNPKQLKIVPLDAAQIPRSLSSASAAVINGNFAMQAGLNPAKDSLLTDSDEINYANIISVLPSQENNEDIKKLVEVLHSQEVSKWIDSHYQGAVVAVK